MSKYQLAFGQQSSDCFYKLQYSTKKIEVAFNNLFTYAQAKANNSDFNVVSQALTNFVNSCSNNDCDDSLRFVISAMNGGDLNAGFNDNIGCDLAELLQRGDPSK
jgi:hypothetical protein